MITVNGTSTETLPVPLSHYFTKPENVTLDIEIGQAVASDAAAIANVGAKVFTATFGHVVSPDDMVKFLASTYTEAAVQADLEDPSLQTWTARDGASGKVLAFVQLVRGESRPCLPGEPAQHAELRRLYVDVAAQGSGIGRRLVAAVEEQARAEGFKQLWLAVWEHNTKAQKMYSKLGFEKVGTIGFRTGDTVHDEWLLSKSL